MGNHHNCATFVEIIKVLNYCSLIFCIKCIGSFIQEYEIRILINSAGYKYALFLTLAQSDSITPDNSVVLQRKPHNIVMNICNFCSLFKPFYIYFAIIDSYIPGYRLREYHSILHDYSTMTTPPFEVIFVDVTSSDRD